MPIDRDRDAEREARLTQILERIAAAERRHESAEIRLRNLIDSQEQRERWLKKAKAEVAKLKGSRRKPR
jgi:hypothetical protein